MIFRRVTNLSQSRFMHVGVKDVRENCAEGSTRPPCAWPGARIVVRVRAVVSNSLSVFVFGRGAAGNSAGASRRFMLYLNQLNQGDAGGLRGTFPFVARLRQAVLEHMSLGLALSLMEVGR